MAEYKSIFVPEIPIDLANYITELLLVNFLKWQKKPIPNSPFWRTEIAEKSPVLQELAKRYMAEISYVHDLLKVVSAEVLIKYIKDTNLAILRFLKAETRQKVLAELFDRQIKFVKSIECISKREIEETPNKVEFIKTNQFTGNKRNKLGTL